MYVLEKVAIDTGYGFETYTITPVSRPQGIMLQILLIICHSEFP